MKFEFGALPDLEATGSIDGHPAVQAVNPDGDPITITCCAECGKLRSILILPASQREAGRWYCTACRTTGQTNPTVIPVA